MSFVLSGQFFEVLVGARPEPLWRLLSRIGLLYLLEPVFTVLFVVNMNAIWEKVMSAMRAQIFRRVLIQKVNLGCNWRRQSLVAFFVAFFLFEVKFSFMARQKCTSRL